MPKQSTFQFTSHFQRKHRGRDYSALVAVGYSIAMDWIDCHWIAAIGVHRALAWMPSFYRMGEPLMAQFGRSCSDGWRYFYRFRHRTVRPSLNCLVAGYGGMFDDGWRIFGRLVVSAKVMCSLEICKETRIITVSIQKLSVGDESVFLPDWCCWWCVCHI